MVMDIHPIKAGKGAVDNLSHPNHGRMSWKYWVLIAGGVGAGYYVYTKYTASQTADADATEDTDSSGDLTGDDDASVGTDDGGAYDTDDTGYAPAVGTTPGINDSLPTTNISTKAQWIQSGIDYLTANGYADITATTALTEYVTAPGTKLASSANYNAAEAAVAYLGLPPGVSQNPLPPATTTTAKPAPKPAAKPAPKKQTASSLPPPAGTWYRVLPSGGIYVIQGNVKHLVSKQTLASLKKNHRYPSKFTVILATDPRFTKAKSGGKI